MWGFELLVMLAMIGINSVLAAYEIALASVTLARLGILVEEKRPGAGAALHMKRNIEGSLAGIQLGITLVGAIAAATGGAGAGAQLAPYLQTRLGFSADLAEFVAIAAVVIPLTALTILFGELIPKVFALRNKELVCLRLSPPILWFVTIVRPVVWTLETIVIRLMSWSERRLELRNESAEIQELRASVALARTSRRIGQQEEQIIMRAAVLTTRPVREIMLPVQAINMLTADVSIDDALSTAHLDMHTRFPVAERKGDPQTVIGYVNFKDIIANQQNAEQGVCLRAILRKIPSFEAETPVSACLERLIQDHVHIALIRDTQGQVIGMVTMEDMLEELVGDIEDEYDHLPTHLHTSGRGWTVGGGTPLKQLHEATGIELGPISEENPVTNLSEWVCQQQTVPLQGGEVIPVAGYRVMVRKVRRHRVLEARIERWPGGAQQWDQREK